jgi:seryl-tRNA synthetase
MLDLKAIRRDPEPVRAALARRRDGSDERLDAALALDARRRELLPEVESLRARQNEASQAIGRAKQEGRDASAEIAEMQDVARRVKALGEELSGVEAELETALALLPNPPDPTATDTDTTIREVGEAGRTGPDHLELAGDLIDMEAGARVAGSRFAYLKGDLVLLEFALVRWAMEVLRGHGFEPVVPPVLVREEALYGTGFLPDTEQQIYRLGDDPLYLAGTSDWPASDRT